jgi:hypothetical protein
MIPLPLLAAGVLAVFTAGAAISYQLTSDHYKAAALDQAEQMNVVSAELERARHEKQVVYRTITRRVEKVVERDVYRNVCLDDDGVRLVNSALAGRADPGQPAAAVPATGAAGR